jgi:RHS repeat-associated protein
MGCILGTDTGDYEVNDLAQCLGSRNTYNAQGYMEKTTEARNSEQANAVVYQTNQAMDAYGNITQFKQGNGVVNTRAHNPHTGYLSSIVSTDANNTIIQNHSYVFDGIGNLRERTRRITSESSGEYKETFQYDPVNRLISINDEQTVSYFANGNIKTKHDVENGATYTYGTKPSQCGASASTAGPNAVSQVGQMHYCYDANGNQTHRFTNGTQTRRITYSAFDKPLTIEAGGERTTFAYDTSRNRYKRHTTANGDTTTLYYIGNVEVVQVNGERTEMRRYLPNAIQTAYSESGAVVYQYLQKDHLGTIDSITNAQGALTKKLFFDVWGAREAVDNSVWGAIIKQHLSTSLFSTSAIENLASFTPRGFTGHEHVDHANIIHMNGRIYDPTLGRFLQADPFIQAPNNSQNYNRYSYVLNNPLSYTDPSGYFFKSLFKAVKKYWRVIAAAVVTYFTAGVASGWAASWGLSGWAAGAASGAIAGAAGGFVATGSLRGALMGAFSGAVFGAIGGHFGDKFGKFSDATLGQQTQWAGSHALAGGVISELSGGKFGHGFVSAGFTKFAMGNAGFDFSDKSTGAVLGRTTIAAIIGGTASKLSGGKFGNGAGTAAMAHLLNAESWKSQTENTKSLTVTNPVTGKDEVLQPNFHPVRDSEGNLMLDMNGNVMSVHHSMLTKFVIPYGKNATLLSCQQMQACNDSNWISDSPMTNLSKPRISTNSVLSNPAGIRIVGNGWFMTQPGPTIVITGATKMGEIMWCSNSSAVQAACGGN